MGNGLIEVGIHLVVSIQQVQLHTTDIDTPDIGIDMVVHVGHIDNQRIAILIHLAFDGQVTEVLRLVVGNLLAIHCQALREIAEAIQEADGTHIDV